MTTIDLVITGDTPFGIALQTLTRSDTGAAVAPVVNGQTVTLPTPFAGGAGGVWTFAFTDPSPTPPAVYLYSYLITWLDGSTTPGSGTEAATGKQSGYYTSQQAVESLFGALNVAKWSNKDNTGQTTADPTAMAAALSDVDTQVDYEAMTGGYSLADQGGLLGRHAIPRSSDGYNIISYWATRLTGSVLYFSRGLRDKANDKEGWDGKLRENYDEARQQIRRVFVNGIPDVSRVGGRAPFVVMPPGYPIGANPVGAATTPRVI